MWTLGLLILFGMLLSLPMTYKATRAVFGSWVAGTNGTPERGGLLLHGFLLVVLLTVWSRTVSTFVQPAFAKPVCKVNGAPSSVSPCPSPATFDSSDVGQKCRAPNDPKGVALGWVQPDLVTCSYKAPPPVAPSQIFN